LENQVRMNPSEALLENELRRSYGVNDSEARLMRFDIGKRFDQKLNCGG